MFIRQIYRRVAPSNALEWRAARRHINSSYVYQRAQSEMKESLRMSGRTERWGARRALWLSGIIQCVAYAAERRLSYSEDESGTNSDAEGVADALLTVVGTLQSLTAGGNVRGGGDLTVFNAARGALGGVQLSDGRWDGGVTAAVDDDVLVAGDDICGPREWRPPCDIASRLGAVRCVGTNVGRSRAAGRPLAFKNTF
ncbi:hypothetical protein FGB62_20g27 [Gracilaria domingensis]|nr:hypothetical protein FGB62_20g27 [Gracilaria domingensis]